MEILEAIKNRVSMREVLEMYGIYPVRGTNIYRCFAHNDKKPSANIIKGTDIFHCFSCQYSGDIFAVVQHFEKCDFKTSMRILDDKFKLGLYKQLSHKEKLEIARRLKERERQRENKKKWEQFELRVLNAIADKIKFWEQMQKTCHLTRGEFNRGEWELGDLFFHSLKRQQFLHWLYNALCEFDHTECEFDYTFPTDKMQLLQMIKKGEMVI